MQTILIVEDNPSHMRLAVALLERFGYTVVQARDGEEGLRLAGERRPDLIVMDVQLPGIDGLTATRRLKDDPATHAIPVIMQTSYLAEHPESELKAAGAVDVIAKPYHYKDFLAAIGTAMP